MSDLWDSKDVGNKQLFFARVPNSASEDDISAAFSPFGPVLDVVIFQSAQGTGKHKGCGLITMGSHEAAAAAILALHHQVTWAGCSQPMKVSWMDPTLQTPAHHGTRLKLDIPPLGCDADAIKLFVGNVPVSYSAEQLLPIFHAIGPIIELGLIRDKQDSSKSKGCAFVWFKRRCDAERAIAALNLQHILPGPTGQKQRPLVVRSARNGVPAAAPNNNTANQFAGSLTTQQLLLASGSLQGSGKLRPQSSQTVFHHVASPPQAHMHGQRSNVISAPMLTTATAPTMQYVLDGDQVLLMSDCPQQLSQPQHTNSTLLLLQPSSTLEQLLPQQPQLPQLCYVTMPDQQPPQPQYLVLDGQTAFVGGLCR